MRIFYVPNCTACSKAGLSPGWYYYDYNNHPHGPYLDSSDLHLAYNHFIETLKDTTED